MIHQSATLAEVLAAWRSEAFDFTELETQ